MIPNNIWLSIIFFTETANGQFYWVYRGLKGLLETREGQKPKFFFTDERRKLMYPDLIDMSAPAHALAIRNDIDVRQSIHSQFEKRAANIIFTYRTNNGKKSWEKLD